MSREAELADLHRVYRDFNQHEREDCVRMVELGHPDSSDYRELRGFFESLRYACNSNARLFSYGGSSESTEYHGPRLDLSWYPEDIDGFSHVYPAHKDWDAYIEAVAKVGWPTGAVPSLDCGMWIVTTAQPQFHSELTSLLRCNPVLVSRRREDGKAGVSLTIRLPRSGAVELNRSVVEVIQRFHSHIVLEPKRQKDVEADNVELPMSQKTMVLANVPRITVTKRQVLVPIIPLSTAGDALAKEVVDGLIKLVGQGLPFQEVSPYLKRRLKPAAFQRLRAELRLEEEIGAVMKL